MLKSLKEDGKPDPFLLSKGRGQNEGGLGKVDSIHVFPGSIAINWVSSKDEALQILYKPCKSNFKWFLSHLQSLKDSPRFADAHCILRMYKGSPINPIRAP